jgi:diguanylate cyclase (GGDEF)-like protein
MQRAIEPETPAPESPATDQTRLQPIVDAIAALTRRDLGARAPVSSRGDLIDAVAAGVNKLGEELAAASAGVERRVRERTSELARTNLELARRALYDPLTELPNRALYEDRLGHLLAGIQGRGGRLSVLSLEVERFAELSQTLGHASMETLLVEVAGRLRRTVRPTDTASRFRDGHFAVILPSTGRVAAEQVAQRLDAALRRPLALDGREMGTTCRIGVAAWEPGLSADELLRNAETALAAAKASPDGRYTIYHPSLETGVGHDESVRGDLRGALDRGELRLIYQPIVDLRTGRIAAVEAFAGWRHPTRGEISPGVFIPVADELGLMPRLGRWVLEAACRQARRWQVRYPSDSLLRLTVNLSATQLRDPELVNVIRSALTDSALAPEDLLVEAPEGTLADHQAEASLAFGRLREMGVRTAVDDYGTGHASLGFLRRLPLDAVKIDRSLIRGIGVGPQDQAFVTGMVQLIQTLGLTTIAAGVEEQPQHAYLRSIGCDQAQGLYYSGPLEIEAAETVLGTPRRALERQA